MINKTKKAAEAEIEIIGKKKIKENNKVGMTKNDKIETDQIEIGIILLSIQLNSLQEWIQVALGIKMRINQDTKKIQLSQNLMIFSQEQKILLSQQKEDKIIAKDKIMRAERTPSVADQTHLEKLLIKAVGQKSLIAFK